MVLVKQLDIKVFQYQPEGGRMKTGHFTLQETKKLERCTRIHFHW